MSSASIRVTSKEPQPTPRLGGPGLMVLLAFLVPALVFAAILAAVAAWEGGQTAQRAAMQHAREAIAHADAEIKHDLRALAAVAKRIVGTPITQSRPNPQAAAYTAELFPEWIGSLVWRQGEQSALYSSLPSDSIPSIPASWSDRIGENPGPVVDGVEMLQGMPVVLVHVRVPDERNLILTNALRPERFLDILMDELPEGAVGAIVDRDGEFIARSLDNARRVATPATIYVRNAVKAGGEGAYRGRTFEGLANHTAYHTSALTGWSAHVAISDRIAQAPVSLAMIVAAAGGLLSLVLAGGLVWLILQDTRRRQQTERALAQAQRIESMGRLTGGVAHDFNNLLTVIIGNLERAKAGVGAPDSRNESRKSIEEALTSARRAASLTRSLLLYSRQQPLSAHTIDLNALVRDAAEVIRRTLDEPYQVVVELDENAGAVRVDSAQLASALLNLAVNSRDAMEQGGTITLRTSRRTLAKHDDDLGLPSGEYAEVSVADTGPGMSSDVARRAFEPFFTTKDVGKGTGLGLAQVDGFARQSGGVAQLETTPGQGTTITLLFPRVGEAPKESPAAPEIAAPQKALRVLLVEDEPGVREHARQLLASLGHRVTVCPDAACAEALLPAGAFDLLFSDIVLPGGKSGVNLADLAARLQPGIAILLATGYARAELDGREEAYPVLFKPYGFAELAAAIASAVSGRQSASKILLVEDEPLIRMMSAATLADAGFEVVEAASLAQAREAFTANPDAFSLAIIDIGLPDGSGADLALSLRERRPDLRIMIASGQAAPSLPPSTEFLPKPYAPDDLERAVKRG